MTNLRGTDLSVTNLRGTDLSGADLSGANLRGANLRGANLRGANLRMTNLRGTDLSVTNLRGADLSGADLSGADLSGADLSGVYLSGATIGEHMVVRLIGRTTRSDGYEFIAFETTTLMVLIRADCQTLLTDDYRAHVAFDYPDSPKAVETLAILDFLASRQALATW